MLSGLLVLILTCPPAFATDITKISSIHEVGLAVPWRHLDTVLRGEFPAERMHTYDYANLSFVAQEVPFVIPQTKISILFNLQPGEFKNLTAAWNMASLAVKIETSPFKVEKTFVENVGGVMVSVKLAAECQGLTVLQQNADARVEVALSTNGSDVQSKVNELTFHWNQEWWVGNVSCEGPRGFGELMAKELRLKLADAAFVESLVKETLHVKLEKEIQDLVTKAMVPQVVYGDGKNQIVLHYKKIESLGDMGLLVLADLNIPKVLGIIETNPTESKNPVLVPLTLTENDLALVKEKPMFFLPKAAFLESARLALSTYIYRGDLTSFPSFQDLMKSRFLQFFVWPDLRKYPKDSKFPFQTRMQQISNLSFDKGLKAKLSGTVESWLQSQRDGSSWNYLYTSSTLSTDATISVAAGAVKLTLKNTKLKSKAQMYPEYIARFKPSKSISTGILDSAIKGSVLSQGLAVTLPVFSVNANSYKATKIYRSSVENLAVEF